MPGTPGVPESSAAQTIVLPYNDRTAVADAFRMHGPRIACLITEASPGNMGIDWIVGSAQVGFADYHAVRGGLVGRTSDHPFVWASATIGPAIP